MPKNKPITFIDLYAGIGGIRFGFEQAGAKCLFSSEWDKFAQITYEAFHGEKPDGDIHEVNIEDIPDHNILTAGFPCQPFSLAGVSKKNSLGISHGFADPTQGTEFFKVKEILEEKQPECFLLENVKNLLSHDEGKTFAVIKESLDNAGYDFEHKVIDAAGWVPQHRERIYIIGFKKEFNVKERIKDLFPDPPENRLCELEDILLSPKEIDPKYTLTPKTWATLERHKENHAEKGNGFGYGLITPPIKGKVTRTMSARYHKDGAEILISQGEGNIPRRLTPLEACRLQGFPQECEDFFNGKNELKVSDGQLYRQFGNSVAVPVIYAVASGIVKMIKEIIYLESVQKSKYKIATG